MVHCPIGYVTGTSLFGSNYRQHCAVGLGASQHHGQLHITAKVN